MYAITYSVRGSGPFPIDMLRYDQSFPTNADSISAMSSMMDRHKLDNSIHTVQLTHIAFKKSWMPTVGRWQSFGWAVDWDSVDVWKL